MSKKVYKIFGKEITSLSHSHRKRLFNRSKRKTSDICWPAARVVDDKIKSASYSINGQVSDGKLKNDA